MFTFTVGNNFSQREANQTQFFLLNYLNVISKLDGSPDACLRFDILSDSKSSIVMYNVRWVSQEFRGSEFYSTHFNRDSKVKSVTLVWACRENGRKQNSQKGIIYESGNNAER
jgi:hypothetical protein